MKRPSSLNVSVHLSRNALSRRANSLVGLHSKNKASLSDYVDDPTLISDNAKDVQDEFDE